MHAQTTQKFQIQSVLFVAAHGFALSALMLVAAVIPQGNSPGEAPFRYEFLIAVLVGMFLAKLIPSETALLKAAGILTVITAGVAYAQHLALQMLPPDLDAHLIGFILVPALMGIIGAGMLCLGSGLCVTLSQPQSERVTLHTLLAAQIITMAGYSTLPYCNLYHVMQLFLGIAVCLKIAEHLVSQNLVMKIPLLQKGADITDASTSVDTNVTDATTNAGANAPDAATPVGSVATNVTTPQITAGPEDDSKLHVQSRLGWMRTVWQALFGLGLIALIASLSWGTHVFINPDEQPLLNAYPWIYLGGLMACGLIYALGRKTWIDVQDSRHALLILASAGLLCAGLVNYIEHPLTLVISMTITGMGALVIIFVLWVSMIQTAQALHSNGWNELRALVSFFVLICFVGFILPRLLGLAAARVIVPLAAACYFLVVSLSYEKQVRKYKEQLSSGVVTRLSGDAETSASEGDKAAPSQEYQVELVAARYGLSARETEVLGLLAIGFSANYIADQLCISPYTAKTHIKNIYSKLNVHTKDELISCVLAEDELTGESDE